ncbi:unannotated protein [freshwater metagenome]|uniref:Unannotated protein n=1 Tax=freshwater metagenome TaxID=449393 RepID=A0A6J6X137_9ZZZZ
MGQCASLAHRQRQDPHDVIAVDQSSVRINGQTTIGISIVRDASVSSVLEDGGLQRLRVCRTTVVINGPAIESVRQHHNVRAKGAQRLGTNSRGGTIGAIDDNAQPIKTRWHGCDQMIDIGLGGRQIFTHPADLFAYRERSSSIKSGLNGIFLLIGELVPTRAEELNAVIGHRVMASRQHHAQGRACLLSQQRNRRSRNNTNANDIKSRAGQTSNNCSFEEFTGRPRITTNYCVRSLAASQHSCRRSTQAQGKVSGQINVGKTTHTVGSKQTRHGVPPYCVNATAPERSPRQ